MQNHPEYRLLQPHEIIKAGDEYLSNGGQNWAPCLASVGKNLTFFQNNNPVRRRAYRLLGKGEIVVNGDEYNYDNSTWKPTCLFEHTISKSHAQKFRRQFDFPTKLVEAVIHPAWITAPILAPEQRPIVSGYRNLTSGERVQGGDEAFASPWNQWVSIFSCDGNFLLVRDYVAMGKGIHGFRRKVEAAKPAPTQPSGNRVEWRILKGHEVMQTGDEIQYTGGGKWNAVIGLVGSRVETTSSTVRRRVETAKPAPALGTAKVMEPSEADRIHALRADIEAISKRIRTASVVERCFSRELVIAQERLDESFMWLGCELKRIKEENKSAKSNS